MGMYNEIEVNCDDCGGVVTFQSKSGECALRTYHISNMPPEDMAGIIGDVSACPNCGRVIVIGDSRRVLEDFSHLVK